MTAKRRSKQLKRAAPIVTIAVVVGAMAGAMALTAGGNSGNHSVVLVNKQDGKTESRSGYMTSKNMSDTVDNQNAAAATSANCTGCRTVAVAVQVVLAENSPSVVTPGNLALAINLNCTSCETAAFAYQYVITTNGPSHFSAEGNQTIAGLRRQIEAVADSDSSLFEIDAQLDGLVDQLWTAVDEELVEANARFSATELEDEDYATGSGSPSPSPTTSESASPSPDGTPSTSPDCVKQAPSPSPSPSDSPIEVTETVTCPTASPTPADSPAKDTTTEAVPQPGSTSDADAGDSTAEPSPSGSAEPSPSGTP